MNNDFDSNISRIDRNIKILWVTGPLAIVVQILYWTGSLHNIIQWIIK